MSFHDLAVLIKKMIRETVHLGPYSPILWRWGFGVQSFVWLVFLVFGLVLLLVFFFIIIICLFLNFSFLFSKLKFGVLVGEVIA